MNDIFDEGVELSDESVIENTLVRPTPGRTRAPERSHERDFLRQARAIVKSEPLCAYGHNPLTSLGYALLSLGYLLRNTTYYENTEKLKGAINTSMAEFMNACKQQGIPKSERHAAHYALCAFLDDAIIATPWGSSAGWARESLVIQAYKDSQSGDRFFEVLDKYMQKPRVGIHVLELMYLCLSFGFQGKYALYQDGAYQLNRLRTQVYRVISDVRGPSAGALSVAWLGVDVERQKPKMSISLSTLIMLMVAVLMLGYWVLYAFSDRKTEGVLEQVGLIRPGEIHYDYANPNLTDWRLNARVKLVNVFADEIEKGLFSVINRNGLEVIVLQGDDYFVSARASLTPSSRAHIERIGKVLSALAGTFHVTGHTDSIPIRSLRYASNEELSLERARSVVGILSQNLAPERITFAGLGSQKPFTDLNQATLPTDDKGNNSQGLLRSNTHRQDANRRAFDRRVEIEYHLEN